MTKEEAEEILSRPFNMKNVPQDVLEAHRMAIKALEQETVTEFADRCRECGAKYGKLLKKEPKTGYWIRRNSFLVPYKCSECNYKSERYDNYCPNCGAKMEVSE